MIEEQQERVIHLPLTKCLNFIANLYILVIGGLLPLYHRDGFTMIGDRKYRLFFIATIGMIPMMLILHGVKFFHEKSSSLNHTDTSPQYGNKGFQTWSILDLLVSGYGVAVLASFLCSPYKSTAWWGYEDWHMGTVTQLLFVGIYFAVSRCWKVNKKSSLYLLAISGVIFLLGILNRFAVDPLQMYDGLEYWNKTHLLATMGNINWYCGYVCTLFSLGLWLYMEWSEDVSGKREFMGRHKSSAGYWGGRILLALYIVLGFGTLITQGSTSGLVVLVVLLLLLLGLCIGSVERTCRFLEGNLLLGITAYLLGRIYQGCDKTQLYFAVDLEIERILLHPIWKYYIVIIFMLYGLAEYNKRKSRRNRMRQGDKYQKTYYITLVIIFAVSVIIIGGQMTSDWGSGRGLLWKTTWSAYCEMPLHQQLFGVGADCYAPYMGEHYAGVLSGFLAEWWGNAVVACAHNEWLNTLINLGVVGMVSYMGIFAAFIYLAIGTIRQKDLMKLRKLENPQKEGDRCLPEYASWLSKCLGGIVLCVLAYCVNNTFSFQQVLSTPLVFLLMGMGECLRKELIKLTQ